MKKVGWGCCICCVIVAASLVMLARWFFRDMRRDVERSFGHAYFRYRCAAGRWPRSTEELIRDSAPEYRKELRDGAEIFKMAATQGQTSDQAVVLEFSGWYLGQFEDSITFYLRDGGCHSSNNYKDFFPSVAIRKHQ